jgi:hypothetical protein
MKKSNESRTWPEILAAYVDGELDESTAAEVANRLQFNSAFGPTLEGQAALSPKNHDFWRRVEPPSVHPLQWAKVWQTIDQRVAIERNKVLWRRSRWFRRGLLGAVLAVTASAAASMMAFGVSHPTCSHRPQVSEPTTEVFAVIDPAQINILSAKDDDLPRIHVHNAIIVDDLPLISRRHVRLEPGNMEWDDVSDTSDDGNHNAPMILVPRDRSR